MALRYVVLVKPPDDHPAAVRVMGTFRDRARAEHVRDAIRERCDSVTDIRDPMATGYAYLALVERPSIRAAIRWALRGERA